MPFFLNWAEITEIVPTLTNPKTALKLPALLRVLVTYQNKFTMTATGPSGGQTYTKSNLIAHTYPTPSKHSLQLHPLESEDLPLPAGWWFVNCLYLIVASYANEKAKGISMCGGLPGPYHLTLYQTFHPQLQKSNYKCDKTILFLPLRTKTVTYLS